MVSQIQRQIVEANGAELYTEVSGRGPSVLFISGATGDGGHFERVAEALSDEFRTIIYDRRGNSRSPRPASWNTTSTDEQADDAAALLRTLGLAPAVIFATSGGGVIGLNLLLRHANLVRGMIIHEPALLAVLPDPQSVLAQIKPIVEQGMAKGGPRGAVEAFLRTVNGDAGFEGIPPELQERMLNNGETLFQVEFGVLEAYRPGDAELASVERPVEVMAGTESPPFLGDTSRWLAAALNTPLRTLPGGHAPYLVRPEAIASELRPYLARLAK
jgi:pimeloyl-ACP methyl ester carboxylesterase